MSPGAITTYFTGLRDALAHPGSLPAEDGCMLVVAAMTLARIDGPEALRTIDGALELIDSPAPPRTSTA